MRSIRRSMTVYMLVLLAATLAVVWVVIDQVTARALAARETAVADQIEAQYRERCRAERERIDQALLQQAKELHRVMHDHYLPRWNAEVDNYNRIATAFYLGLLTNPFDEYVKAFIPAVRPWPGPNVLARLYFANLSFPEEDIRHFDEESRGVDYFQINTLSGRDWHSQSLGPRKLPFDAKEIDAKAASDSTRAPGEPTSLIDWTYRDSNLVPDGEQVRRVLYKAPLYFTRSSRGFRPPPGVAPGFGPRSLLGMWGSWLNGAGPPPPGITMADTLPRLYVQCARPQSQIDAAMDKFAVERDGELSKLTTEIRHARRDLRFDITTIGLVAFMAVALGGPLLVGRGLRPVGKLSDAVSRVSEKDFKLPHDGSNLSVELVPIHARLTQTLDQLQRAFTREKQAVADISHELRTPIAALMATIDVALRKQRTPEQYRTALEECRLISKQLGQLVERIMTLATLDAGNDRVQLARVDASELAASCAAVIRPLAAANNITVDLHADPGILVNSDASKLREVLMNLLHNAVEYNRADGVIELSAFRHAETAVFEVRDTGIGIAPDVKDRIFERFFRADPSRHSTGIHAGLGLAIVKEYVERLKGSIAVESTPGVGTAFRVSIPATRVNAAEEHAAEPVAVTT